MVDEISWSAVFTVIAGVLTILNVGPLLVKLLPSKKEAAETKQTTESTENLRIESADLVVKLVREELDAKVEAHQLMNDRYNSLDLRFKGLTEVYEALVGRMFKFERMILVHEKWDQEVYKLVQTLDPTFPAPPKLKDEDDG